MVQLGRANQGQCEKTGRGVSDNMKIKIWKLIFIIFVIRNFQLISFAEVGPVEQVEKSENDPVAVLFGKNISRSDLDPPAVDRKN